MITIILNHHNMYAEIDMPVMYEELQLALWKLGLDRVPEKYTLQDMDATFRYQSPLEYFVLRLLEGGMSLLDAVSAIYTVIAPPRPIMAQVQILCSSFQSITELRQEMDRLIKTTVQFGSTCFFPVRGWLVGLDGEMEPARDAVMLQHAEVIGEAVQRMSHRCPTAEFVGTGVIDNYELQFKGSLHNAHATIAPKEGSSVPVGIWKIQKLDERRLDVYEGYPSYYFKQDIPVQMQDKTVTGMVYIMDQRMDFGNPSKGYYDIVHEGYEDCGLDTAVLDQAVNDSMDQAQQRMEYGGMRFF